VHDPEGSHYKNLKGEGEKSGAERRSNLKSGIKEEKAFSYQQWLSVQLSAVSNQ